MIDDDEFTEFVEKNNISEDELIEKTVYAGWTKGLSTDMKNQYWPPELAF